MRFWVCLSAVLILAVSPAVDGAETESGPGGADGLPATESIFDGFEDLLNGQPLPEFRTEPPRKVELTPGETEELKSLLRSFLSAKSVADLKPIIRFPERVTALMDDYYSRHDFLRGKVHVNPRMVQSGRFIFVTVRHGKQREPSLLAVDRSGEKMKVDWEAFTLYSSVPWATLNDAGTGQQITLRGIITRAAKDSHEGGEVLYDITHPNSGEKIEAMPDPDASAPLFIAEAGEGERMLATVRVEKRADDLPAPFLLKAAMPGWVGVEKGL